MAGNQYYYRKFDTYGWSQKTLSLQDLADNGRLVFIPWIITSPFPPPIHGHKTAQLLFG